MTPVRVVAVEDGQEEIRLVRFWRSISTEHRAQGGDGGDGHGEAYWNSTVRHVPDATSKIVYDNFHLALYMKQAADEVRRWERAPIPQAHDTLTGPRQHWLCGLKNVPRKRATASKPSGKSPPKRPRHERSKNCCGRSGTAATKATRWPSFATGAARSWPPGWSRSRRLSASSRSTKRHRDALPSPSEQRPVGRSQQPHPSSDPEGLRRPQPQPLQT